MKNQTLSLPPGYDPDVVVLASGRVDSGYVSPDEVSSAVEEMLAINRVASRLLPVEKLANTEVLVAQETATKKCARLQHQQKVYEFSEGEYMLQDLEPLTWRDEMGFPRLMVFHPGVAEAGFEGKLVRGSSVISWPSLDAVIRNVGQLIDGSLSEIYVKMVPSVPKEMSTCYYDIVAKVKAHAKAKLAEVGKSRIVESLNVQLKARFSGLIPEDVKIEMHRAYTSGLFVNFFIIAEVKKWEWDVQVVSRPGDPLLIGYDGHQYWLIKAFDTTTWERVMAEEFSVRVH